MKACILITVFDDQTVKVLEIMMHCFPTLARRQSSDRISTPVRRALVLHLQQKSTAFAL